MAALATYVAWSTRLQKDIQHLRADFEQVQKDIQHLETHLSAVDVGLAEARASLRVIERSYHEKSHRSND